ncbi:DUF397 domain-containing protein [Spirillospora sp. CA-128828]|uniref:DUF397 domain-containing protein n=1 Tax=Spirillospora sp. CA-128828 TaxID=3240033 RepID=UPI003D901C7B
MIRWRKASRSDGQGGACVELARFPETVAVRDSKDPSGPQLHFTPSAFRAILNDLKP